MWTWLIATALAAPPTTSVVDGVIVSRMSLPAPVAAVPAKVADPLWVNRTEGGITEAATSAQATAPAAPSRSIAAVTDHVRQGQPAFGPWRRG